MEIITAGVCAQCEARVDKASAAEHLGACPVRRAGTDPMLDLLVEAEGAPFFWLHILASPQATFRALDALLRRTWLDCCGHCSEFRAGDEEIDLGIELRAILRPGIAIDYDYDFGSTTSLTVRAMGELTGHVGRREARVAMRNEMPPHACQECGKEDAASICGECERYLGPKCGRKHGCDEEMALPVVNSPRAGVCGYTG